MEDSQTASVGGQPTRPKKSGWGGTRRGAGRKPKSGERSVPHVRRPDYTDRVLVTLRMKSEAFALLPETGADAIKNALSLAHKDGFAVQAFCLHREHLSLIITVRDTVALSHGMQGLGIRTARALNRTVRRRGSFFASRYEVRPIRGDRELEHLFRRGLAWQQVPGIPLGEALYAEMTRVLGDPMGVVSPLRPVQEGGIKV